MTPMMKQFNEIKQKYPDTLLFYRVGDFYELYYEDAVIASRELNIVLTGRDNSVEGRVHMAGVPHHAADPYIARLVEKGYKVAVCEQVAMDTDKKGCGLFRREVVKVVTAGTITDNTVLDEKKNNYIVSVYLNNNRLGVAWADISTAEFNYTEIDPPLLMSLGEILTRISPSEIICNEEMAVLSTTMSVVKLDMICPFTLYKKEAFYKNEALEFAQNQFSDEYVKELSKNGHALIAAGALFNYINDTQMAKMSHINRAEKVNSVDFMFIDHNARRHFELTENLSDSKRKGSLLWVLDKTITSMGARRLRKILLEPPLDERIIHSRQEGVEELLSDKLRDSLQDSLKGVFDIERLIGKLSTKSIGPREILSLANSLSMVKRLNFLLAQTSSPILQRLNSKIVDFEYVYAKIIKSIIKDAPVHTRDGGFILGGIDKELDEYRYLRHSASELVAGLEAQERATTGIKNLRINFVKNAGYYIELARGIENVPYRFIRIQTLKNTERYTTEELRTLEEKILSAENSAITREQEIFNDLIALLLSKCRELLSTAKAISELDVLLSFAEVSRSSGFIKPKISKNVRHISINSGKHPVVERLLGSELFVPNNALIDEQDSRIIILTGPNMAGKSVYMKQVAMICILAQIGCFVPAKSCEVPILDKIFARIGASDNMLAAQSTFMVEMTEVASILESLTNNSLVIMDEVGRGTATFDGLSIAWGILEHLSKNSNCKVLFSTHYHELTSLKDSLKGIENYKMSLKEVDGNIIFLRHVEKGSSNKSFGIEVAKLAGLPDSVLASAKKILKKLENERKCLT